jgi:hypothetical protein
MRIVDDVLTHMDASDYDIRDYTSLERVVHALHMNEMWTRASWEYEKLKKSQLFVNDNICRCARNIKTNGIEEQLRIIASRIRQRYNDNLYDLRNSERVYDLKQSHEIYDLKQTGKFVSTIPHLNNAAAWSIWRRRSLDIAPTDSYDLALYLYCALNNK